MPGLASQCLSCHFEPNWQPRYPNDPKQHSEGRCGFVSASVSNSLPIYGTVETPWLRRKGDVVVAVLYGGIEAPIDAPCKARRAKEGVCPK